MAEPTSEVTCDSEFLQNGTDKPGTRPDEMPKGKPLQDLGHYRQEPPHANSVDAKAMYEPPMDPAMHGYYPRPYHHSPSDAHNNDGGYYHGQPGIRQPYPGGKGMPMGSPRAPAQPGGYGPAPQRFMSQPPQGPTPTLNQLLQSNQPQQHYQNSYDYHGWGQRPPYQPQAAAPYRNQPPPNNSSPRQGAQPSGQAYYGPPGGAAPPPVAAGSGPYPPGPASPSQQQQQQQPPAQPPGQYPPYPGPGRYPNARPPFSPHQQMPSSYSNQQAAGPGSYQEQQQQQPPPGQNRVGWPHPPSPHPPPPQSPGHGPSEAAVPVPRPSPGPQASPGHPNHPPSPGPAGQAPPPPRSPHQQGNYPPRPQQSSTPTAHAPDQGELSGGGGNSNDSNSGHAGPATPNSGMRPTPSPTGSTSSRSMSPAVGQQNIPMPPRPSSGQSEAPPPRLSQSPLTSGGGYPQPHPYKQQPYPQGNYSPRPGPGAPYNAPPAGYPQQPGGGGQYPPPRPPHQPLNNHSQYPGYQGWGPQPPPSGQMMPGNHIPPNGKAGGPPQPPTPQSPGPGQPPSNAGVPRPHTPPLYLKQHLQHKIGYSGPPPGGYPAQGMGPPGMHHPMGPPPPSGMHHPGMGPPAPQNMGPPHEMPPPPASTPNSHPMPTPPPPPSAEEPLDNGITTAATATAASHGSVTSVITTGPDGQPMDEGSQQSTLSNASAASGDDPVTVVSGKARKDVHNHGPAPSPGTPGSGSAGANSVHDDYDVNSSPTSWPRTPNSPVFNSHVPSETYRSGKPDSLSKLYEMDDAPERRPWLDRLLAFMEERRNPITACPTISKNPLDLFRLYLYVKERNGFMEVTKNKTWKDIAGLLGIGASSSAAYTLRKHYTKNLLAYECHFDRGGIDPQPIINQVEASSKKKGSKVISVPSPGSSNSQDSFPASGPGGGGGGASGGAGGGGTVAGGSMDSYPGYGYPPAGANPEYQGPNQRPPPPNAASPHLSQGGGGMQPSGYPGQYPDQYGRGNEYPQQQYPQQGYHGPMYSQYPPPPGPEDDSRSYPQGGSATPPGAVAGAPTGAPASGPNPQDQYRNYPGNYPGSRPAAPYQSGPPNPAAPPPGPGQGPAAAYPPAQPPQHDYYRQEQAYGANGNAPNSAAPGQAAAPGAAPGAPGKPPMGAMTMPPPAPQPRRHPDFSKEQQPFQPYSGPRPGYGPGPGPGPWPNNNQYRQQYPQQWQGGPRYPTASQPANSYPPPQPMQSWGNSMPVPGVGQGSPLRPAARPQFRPQGPPVMPNKVHNTSSTLPPGVSGSKRELQFPHDSVESVSPILFKRRRLNKLDVAPLEPWRIMMALRSGLIAETSWALDVLNILLFDDTSVAYFGLAHMPGLLEVLLEHWRKTLDDIFEPPTPSAAAEPPSDSVIDLGEPVSVPEGSTRVLHGVCDRTLAPVKGRPIVVEPRSDLFVRDGRRAWDVEDDNEPPDPAAHIVLPNSFEAVHLPFARRLLDSKKETIVKTEPIERTEETPVRAAARRRRDSHCEDECYSRDESSLLLASEANDGLARRCVCISTILRNLSFVPGNEAEMGRSVLLLSLLGRLLLLHHDHPPRVTQVRNYDREEDADFTDSCSSLQGESEWWWDYLHHIRENVLVTCANIAGHMDVSLHAEELSRPLLDGLLHWAVCPAAAGQDPFPTVGPNSVLSPQRLALEALCKLCVTEGNVDLLAATPPYSRLERLCAVLSRFLCRGEEQVLREMSINLLHYLSSAGSCIARTIGLQPPCVSLLLSFVEQAEQSALGVANQLGINALRDNPESMGTSLDMLRRAASTLLHLARHPENRPLFVQHEARLLQLVMSQILDQQVACVLSRVLFQVSRPTPTPS